MKSQWSLGKSAGHDSKIGFWMVLDGIVMSEALAKNSFVMFCYVWCWQRVLFVKVSSQDDVNMKTSLLQVAVDGPCTCHPS